MRKMGYGRRLLLVWSAGSVCWIGYWIWHFTSTCSLLRMGGSRAITCRWESAEPGGMAVMARTAPALPVLWDMASRTVGIPACVLLVGLAVHWAIERFAR